MTKRLLNRSSRSMAIMPDSTFLSDGLGANGSTYRRGSANVLQPGASVSSPVRLVGYSWSIRDCNANETGHRVQWLTVGRSVDGKIPYCTSNVHPADHLPKHCVPSVKTCVVDEIDVELGSRAVEVTLSGHGEVACVVVERVVDLEGNGLR